MKTLLSHVLQRLHSLEAPLVPHRDVHRFPRVEFTTLLKHGVLRRVNDPDRVPNPQRAKGPWVRVSRSGTQAFAVADEDEEYFTPFVLAPTDLLIYEVSVIKLVEWLRRDNAIVGNAPIAESGMCAVGQKQIVGFGAVNVFVSFPNQDHSAFTKACLALRVPSGVKVLVVLTPIPVALSASDAELINQRGIRVVPLLSMTDRNQVMLDWDATVFRCDVERRPNGVYAGRVICVEGSEYKGDLTKREMLFLDIAVRSEEVPIENVWFRGSGALWRSKFVNEKPNRDKVHKFISNLNKKLIRTNPPFPFLFSVARGRPVIVRSTEINC